MPFSSLMFLQPTPPRVTRSSKLENIFLLLLRCLVLCLLALGFARPFLQRPEAADKGAGEGRRIALVLDASASMRRDNLWSEAQARAEKVLKGAVPADLVGVFLLERTIRPLVSFEQWQAMPLGDRVNLALQQVNSAKPSWAGTHLGHGLLGVVEALEESQGRQTQTAALGLRQLVLITDLQEGAHLDGLQGFEWPRGLEVVLEQVKPKRPTNAGLQLLTDHDESAQSSVDNDIKVRVSNSSESKKEQFQLGWVRPGEKGAASPLQDVYVPPGQSRVFSAPKPPEGIPAEQLSLSGDGEEFDNRAYLVSPKPEQIKVLYLGRDAEKDPAQSLYYLRRAFPATRRQIVQILPHPAEGPVPAEERFTAPLLIVGDALSGEGLQAARGFLDAGKPVLYVLRDPGGAPSLAQLAGLGNVSAEEASGENYSLLGRVEFEHPLFAPFADPRFSDFTKIHFWKHRRLNPDEFKEAKVLARFDKGDPALLQVSVSKGLLFILTSGWHPADSQLALSSKFVPFLFSLLDLSGGVKAQMAQYIVGDPVTLPATNAAQVFTVRKPDGTEVKPTGAARFEETDQPGIYTISTPGAAPLRFAVNEDPAESRTAPLPLEQLERLRLPLKHSNPELAKREEQKRLRLQAAELEQRQKLWRWMLLTALLLLLSETWLAGWLTKRSLQAEAAS
jgi:hypothetical protein